MKALYWKLGLTAGMGAIAGLCAGQATIAGMAPPSGIAASRTIGSAADAIDHAGAYVGARPDSTDYAAIADRCDGCSDYDLGYRFAAARHVRESAECMDFSWSYQRGCLARLREG